MAAETPVEEPVRSRAASSELTPEEDALLRAQSMVDGPDGPEFSYRTYNSLRAELRRKKAREARAAAQAEEAERLRVARQKAAAERAAQEDAEKFAATMRQAEESRHRAETVAALKAGEDVDVDFELNSSELEELRDAGFDIPEEWIDSAATDEEERDWQ